MDDLHFFSEVVINDVLNGQGPQEPGKAQETEKTISNDQPICTQAKGTAGLVDSQINNQEREKTMQESVKGVLWQSPLIQNYVHNALKYDRFLDKRAISHLAEHIGISSDALGDYLDTAYPLRGSFTLTDE